MNREHTEGLVTRLKISLGRNLHLSLALLSGLFLTLSPPIYADDTALEAEQETRLQTLAAPLYRLEQSIEYHKLDNGLQLRLLPLEHKHSVAIASQFAVGSRNETQGQTGYAHLFEHMLFKGSQNAPGDSYAQTMSSLSGQFNASTFFDQTNYYLNVPSKALQLALFLESDRFIRPDLTLETVTNQQQTVLEEMATTIDNQPYLRPAMELLLQQVQGTPYSHAVIGSRADIQAATPASLLQFHQRFYRPDTMQLTLVGQLPKQSLTWVENYFSTWPAPQHQAQTFSAPKIQRQFVHQEIIDPRGPWPALLLAWHTVGKNHADAAALSLVESYLLQSRTSLLTQQSLTNPQQLLNFSLPLSMRDIGVMNLVMVPRANVSLDALTEQVSAMINQLASEGISEETLTELKRQALNKQLSQLDNDIALATLLSNTLEQDQATPLSGPWQRINAVTVDDIRRVTQTYLQPGMVRLDLLPSWYIRWGKTLLEWLPKSWSDSLEEKAL
ncbi:pitrilysin family protein [Shewanella sp. Isolate11]|uniref:M16 family metallopeptidase n=1 Tax=Shewanella sp. Isolate11 TaxID=2908530 RepID=UPI001EFDADD4|nr:pitrilysin family protein [Shewanella sp. Isolate11]MCG9697563.1 insulinase family protein [Shewanella sp. Isolate11]